MSETHVTPEMAQLIMTVSSKKVKETTAPNGRKYRVHPDRRLLRNRLFRIRSGDTSLEADGGLKKWMELQFKPGMAWQNFTFEWDVSPSEPLKVVSIHEWVAEGGLLESILDRNDAAGVVMRTQCTPTAFTKQL